MHDIFLGIRNINIRKKIDTDTFSLETYVPQKKWKNIEFRLL